MSGPKHSRWEVARNARLAEQRRQAAIVDAASLRSQLGVTLAELYTDAPDVAARLESEAYRLSPPNNSDSIELFRHFGTALAQLIATTKREAETARVRRQIEAELDAIAVRAREAAREGAARLANELAGRRMLIERLLDRASSLAAGDKALLSRLAGRIMTCPKGQASLLELELRTEIQAARVRADRRNAEIAEAVELRQLLQGFNGAAIEKLRKELEAVEQGRDAMTVQLRESIRASQQQAMQDADRDYAGQVLREEFAALGYDVGEDFITAFQGGGDLQIARASRSDYAVDIRFNPNERALNTELVRTADASGTSEKERALRDKAAEQQWCGDLATIFAQAERRHVRARVESRIPPGAIQVREAAASTAIARRRRPSAKLQEMQRDD